MKCYACGGSRIAEVGGKTSDRCNISIGKKEHSGYVPRDMRIGGGDYLAFDFCLDCGQMQGEFPVPETELEAAREECEEWLENDDDDD